MTRPARAIVLAPLLRSGSHPISFLLCLVGLLYAPGFLLAASGFLLVSVPAHPVPSEGFVPELSGTRPAEFGNRLDEVANLHLMFCLMGSVVLSFQGCLHLV